jgi:hypothetical protein
MRPVDVNSQEPAALLGRDGDAARQITGEAQPARPATALSSGTVWPMTSSDTSCVGDSQWLRGSGRLAKLRLKPPRYCPLMLRFASAALSCPAPPPQRAGKRASGAPAPRGETSPKAERKTCYIRHAVGLRRCLVLLLLLLGLSPACRLQAQSEPPSGAQTTALESLVAEAPRLSLERSDISVAIPPSGVTGAVQNATGDVDRDEQVVRAWVQRWNALGGDNASAVDELLTIYSPDALHITGPSLHQKGTATYRGHDGIRILAARVAASQQRLTYRIETETANEQTAELMHRAAGPWKGPSVAVQIVAVYTERETGKRWAVPAAAFFQLADGKIRRARIYYADGEKAEVEPEPRRRPPGD